MIENIDAVLGRFAVSLEASGELDNTIIIFTSDHGEMLGDCGLWEKFVPHQPSLHVPLVFAGPGVARGGRIDGPATILDLHATVIDLAGAAPIAGVDSRSMRNMLRDPETAHREIVFSGLGQWRMAYDGRFKLIAGYDPTTPRRIMETAVFDRDERSNWRLVEPSSDPRETTDVSALYPDAARGLTDALLANLSSGGAQAPL